MATITIMDADKCSIFKVANPLLPDANGYCYLDEQHFNLYIDKIAKRLIGKHGPLIDRFPIQGRLGLSALLCVAVLLMIFDVISRFLFFSLYLLILLVSTWYIFRVWRFKQTIIRHHMCFKCGYALRKTPTEKDGNGKCRECGEQFNAGYYRKLPFNYKRSLLGTLPTHWTDSVHPLDRARMQDD